MICALSNSLPSMKSFAGRLSAAMIILFFAGLGSWVGCKKENGDEFSRLTNRGRTYYEKGEAEKAIPPFERAVQTNPTHPDARLNLANAYLLANQPLKTIEQAQAV